MKTFADQKVYFTTDSLQTGNEEKKKKRTTCLYSLVENTWQSNRLISYTYGKNQS